MKPELENIEFADKEILRGLMQLYLYDFSEFEGWDVTTHGTFEYRYLDHYWTEEGREAFLVKVDGCVAGFALTRRLPNGARSIAEFFVLRKYRRRGVGAAVAHELLRRAPGPWEIRVRNQNGAALAFWSGILQTFGPVVQPEGDGKTLVHYFSNEGAG